MYEAPYLWEILSMETIKEEIQAEIIMRQMVLTMRIYRFSASEIRQVVRDVLGELGFEKTEIDNSVKRLLKYD